MLAADTSSLVAFLSGEKGEDVEALAQALEQGVLFLPPPVLTEILSDPKLPPALETALLQIPLLEISAKTWEQAGKMRRALLKRKLKSRLGDALIAQCCIENDVRLITRDKDFRHYVKLFAIKLSTPV